MRCLIALAILVSIGCAKPLPVVVVTPASEIAPVAQVVDDVKQARERAEQAERDAFMAERNRYIDETRQVCMERYSGEYEFCFGEWVTVVAIELHVLENGQKVTNEFDIDSSVGYSTAEIARACREQTLDGGLIDGIRALECVKVTVQDWNRTGRRRERLGIESE